MTIVVAGILEQQGKILICQRRADQALQLQAFNPFFDEKARQGEDERTGGRDDGRRAHGSQIVREGADNGNKRNSKEYLLQQNSPRLG